FFYPRSHSEIGVGRIGGSCCSENAAQVVKRKRMAWDWQVFCLDDLDMQYVEGCFGGKGTTTYLDWMLSAWGWTVSVALAALVVAMVLGFIVGSLRTLPNQRLIVGL